MALTYVIAEIGFNHGGDVVMAEEMICAASEAGADGVKFQSFFASDLYFPDHEHYQVFKTGELSATSLSRLKHKADDAGVDFLSTPFSPYWVKILDALDPAGLKIASMDLNNPLLLGAVAGTGRKIYLSTGASGLSEIKAAIKTLQDNGALDIVVFHCVSNYPTRPEDAMLWMIPEMKRELGLPIGFSDHTLGISVSVAAVSLGAEVIEKHFTIDKSLPGPDHALSADPAEMKKLVEALENVQASTASTASTGRQRGPRPDERGKSAMRRGVYADCDIKRGESITADKIKLVRPEVTPLDRLDTILDEPALRSYKAGDPI